MRKRKAFIPLEIRVSNGASRRFLTGFTLTKVSQRSSLVSVDFSIIGQAGEHYGAGIAKNGRRLAAPGLKIVDEAGEVLASGKFAYG